MIPLFKVKEVDISDWKEGDKFYLQVVRNEYKDSLFNPLYKWKILPPWSYSFYAYRAMSSSHLLTSVQSGFL